MSNVKEDFMLTTFDNPINPFENFELWFKTDLLLGHNCCGILDRNSNVIDIANDSVNEERIYNAMKYICEREPTIYRMVTRKDYAVTG